MSATTVNCATRQGITWLNTSTFAPDDELAVFRYHLANQAPLVSYLQNGLSPDEIARANRFRQEGDRLRFMYARGILRVLIGKYIGQHPASIEFIPGINKKPEVKGNVSIHFNVSHSGDWVLLAIGQVPVGVDVEKVNPDMALQEVLIHSFSQKEQHYVVQSSDARLAFYHLWTRKEALVKATAKGIVDEFDQVPSLDGQHHTTTDLIGQAGEWMVYSLAIDTSHAAAVAYKLPSRSPNFYTLDASLFS